MDNTFDVWRIGTVVSPLTRLDEAPRQGDEGAPSAWLVFDPAVAAGLSTLRPGDRILVLSWLDRASRDVLTVHPRGDRNRPEEGVFNTRSPDRPNPIGIHPATITAVDGHRIQVDHLEAIDGTPILDIKPILSNDISER